jgi:putative membrane protein
VFWAAVGRARWHQDTGIGVLVLFVSGLGSGAHAAMLTLSRRPLYHAPQATTVPWHLTPLEDQQLAGAIMWVPGGIVYLLAAAILLVQWLESGPRPEPSLPVRTSTTGSLR